MCRHKENLNWRRPGNLLGNFIFQENKEASCRVRELNQVNGHARGLNRRVCLFSELVTGVTVAIVAQRYASGTRKRNERRSIPDRTEPCSLRFFFFLFAYESLFGQSEPIMQISSESMKRRPLADETETGQTKKNWT